MPPGIITQQQAIENLPALGPCLHVNAPHFGMDLRGWESIPAGVVRISPGGAYAYRSRILGVAACDFFLVDINVDKDTNSPGGANLGVYFNAGAHNLPSSIAPGLAIPHGNPRDCDAFEVIVTHYQKEKNEAVYHLEEYHHLVGHDVGGLCQIDKVDGNLKLPKLIKAKTGVPGQWTSHRIAVWVRLRGAAQQAEVSVDVAALDVITPRLSRRRARRRRLR